METEAAKAIGAGLAAIVDAQIDATVTPMLLGALVYGVLGLGCLVLATRQPAGNVPSPRPVSVGER